MESHNDVLADANHHPGLPFDQSTPKSTPRRFEFIAGTPNSRWLCKLERDTDISQCSPPHSMSICLSPPSPIQMPSSFTRSSADRNKPPAEHSIEYSASETDSIWWQDGSSALLSFLANEQLCSTMLDDEEPPLIGCNVFEQSMECRDPEDEHERRMEGSSFMHQTDCSMREQMASVSQSKFNDTIEAMDFYIEQGRRFHTMAEVK